MWDEEKAEEDDEEEDEDSPEECAVCLGDLDHDIIMIRECCHRFHDRCISRWLDKCNSSQGLIQFNCPYCRQAPATVVR